jgi:putative transposase
MGHPVVGVEDKVPGCGGEDGAGGFGGEGGRKKLLWWGRRSARLAPMPTGLKRYQQTGELHFVTFSCVRHRQILGSAEARDLLLQVLEGTRVRYGMGVHGYVVMPDHVHLLVAEPEKAALSLAVQILKQRFSRTRTQEYVWEPRYYDFNVRTEEKRIEKLRYMHRNPVKRGLAVEAGGWRWSSFRSYRYLEEGPVGLVRG